MPVDESVAACPVASAGRRRRLPGAKNQREPVNSDAMTAGWSPLVSTTASSPNSVQPSAAMPPTASALPGRPTGPNVAGASTVEESAPGRAPAGTPAEALPRPSVAAQHDVAAPATRIEAVVAVPPLDLVRVGAP